MALRRNSSRIWKLAILAAGAYLPLSDVVQGFPPPTAVERPATASDTRMSRPLAAARTTSRKTNGHTPLEVTIGFHINSIDDIDWDAGTFRADLYWWIRYPGPLDPEAAKKIEALEFTNKVEEDVRSLQERKHLTSANQVYASYRTIGRFRFESDFRRYPFDRQRFSIVLEHEALPATELVLTDDNASYARSEVPMHRKGLGASVQIPDLEIQRVSREFSEHEYKTDFGDPEAQGATRFSRVVLAIEVARRSTPYLVKIIIPLIIILILAYLAFFLPAHELDVAVGLTVTSVLACIAIQITLNDRIPNVGYIITSDRIFHLCYFLIMLAMAETVITAHLAKTGREALADRIEKVSRVAYPACFVLGMALLLVPQWSRCPGLGQRRASQTEILGGRPSPAKPGWLVTKMNWK